MHAQERARAQSVEEWLLEYETGQPVPPGHLDKIEHFLIEDEMGRKTGINLMVLEGNLGADPDLRYTGGAEQNAVCSLSVATSEQWRDASGETKERVEWHRVVLFRSLAELASQYLKKGDKVFIRGRLQTRSWEKDGAKRYTTEIVADEMQFMGKSQSQEEQTEKPQQPAEKPPQQQNTKQQPAAQQQLQQSDMGDDIGDDIPFN